MILSVMLLSLSMLFAAQEMSVTWEWLLDDPEVNYYRYQLNGTEDDGWTVVSGDTGVYVAEGLDPYADYTLYLQRSYDGVNWSETASATAEALLVEEVAVEEVEEVAVIEEAPVEEVIVEEEPVVEEEVVVEEVAEEPVVEEVVPVAPVAPVEEKKAPAAPFEFSLLLRPYVEMGFDWKADKIFAPMAIGGGISLDFDNIVAFNENSGLGLRFDVGSTNYAKDGFSDLLFSTLDGEQKYAFWKWDWAGIFTPNNYYHDVNAALLLTIDARAGVLDVSFGLGGGAAILFDAGDDVARYGAYQTWGNDKIDLGAFAAANLGLKFYCGSVFSLGLDAVYKVYFPNYEYNGLNTSLVLGFTF